MINRILVALIFIFSFYLPVQAQIENEIKAFVADSTEIMLNNGRKMLIQSLIKKDYLKARKIYFYLNDEADKRNCNAFNYYDNQHILILLGDWEEWFRQAEQIDIMRTKLNCYKYAEDLGESLSGLVYNQVDKIREETALLSLNAEQKDLLDLFLLYVAKGSKSDEFISKSKFFKKHYKYGGKYYAYYEKSFPALKNDFSFTFSFGPKLLSPTHNLAKAFKSGMGVGFGYDFNFGSFFLSTGVSIAFLPVKTPFSFTHNTTSEVISFDTKDHFSFTNGGLIVGTYLIKNKTYKLGPYLSIGGYTVSSNMNRYYGYDRADRGEFEVINSFYYGPGIRSEIQLVKFDLRPSYFNYWLYGGFSETFLSLKLSAGYDFITQHNFPSMSGNSFYIELGLIWGIGKF